MLKKEESIAPHGGQLVDRTVPAEERDERLREAAELPKVTLGYAHRLRPADDLYRGL
jgi:hypothetical protein